MKYVVIISQSNPLMIFSFGLIGLIIGLLGKSKIEKSNKIIAKNGSVAAGRDINGSINIAVSNQYEQSQSKGVTAIDIWNIFCGIVTIAGFIGFLLTLK